MSEDTETLESMLQGGMLNDFTSGDTRRLIKEDDWGYVDIAGFSAEERIQYLVKLKKKDKLYVLFNVEDPRPARTWVQAEYPLRHGNVLFYHGTALPRLHRVLPIGSLGYLLAHQPDFGHPVDELAWSGYFEALGGALKRVICPFNTMHPDRHGVPDENSLLAEPFLPAGDQKDFKWLSWPEGYE